MPNNDLHLLDSRLESRRVESAPDLDEGEFFCLYVSELLLRRYQPGIPGILSGIVDGVGDCGIDAFYAFINNQPIVSGIETTRMDREPRIDVHIIQAKREQRFTGDALQKLQVHLPELLDFDRDEGALSSYVNPLLLDLSRQLLQICRSVAHFDPQFNFEVHYATRGDSIHPNTRARSEVLESTLQSLFDGARASVTFYGARELIALARRRETIKKELSIVDGPLTSDSGRGQGYACLVDLHDLYQFMCEPESGRLQTEIFESNVRDHYRTSHVNHAISQTLLDVKSPDFWWLNNGVTIVASSARHIGRKLYVEDPQVVNGLQTSSEIHQYFKSGGESGGRLVLVRVIKAQDERVRDHIIRATNNQNELPESALRATDRLQFDLEEYLEKRGFFYDRKKEFYLNRGRPVNKIISIEFLAQAMTACLLLEPWRARGDEAGLMQHDVYPRIFSDDIPHSAYLSALMLVRRVRKLLEADVMFRDSTRFSDDYLFHVSAVATILLSGKEHPSARDLSALDAERLTPASIADLVKVVSLEFRRFIGAVRFIPESAPARDQLTSDSIVAEAKRRVGNSRWRQWPEEPIGDSDPVLGKRVVYTSESRPRRRL